MKPKGKRHNTIPIPLGGQFSAGDLSMLPEGTVSLLRNHVIRPNRFDGRAPFVYDSLDAVSGFAIWQDLANELQKTVATCSADNKLYTKNANGQGYGTGLAGLTASARLTAYTNFLGKLYMAFDNGAGVPASMSVYDGTVLSAAPFNSTINCRSIAAFVDRLFLVYPKVSVFNAFLNSTGTAAAYDLTTGYWALTNITANNVTANGKTVCRLYPTSTTASSFRYNSTAAGFSAGALGVQQNAATREVLWRAAFRNLHASYQMPITLEWTIVNSWIAATAYAVGEIVSDGTYQHRCTTAGVSGGGAPAWAVTVGGTTVDNTVTWTNAGSDIIASLESYIPTATEADGLTPFWVPATVPDAPATVYVQVRCKFFNSATPTITLAPIDVSLKDGIADGNPRKANAGQQVTTGDFFFPFFNQESSMSAAVAIDAVIYSEIENAKQILARNTYPLSEIAGIATAAIVSNGRLVVFKRSGMWIFKGVVDPYEPILPESPAIQVGCLGPRALDCSRDNVLYWIGEGHIYKMAVGSDPGPTEIDSPGMFEEIMARGSGWVETQSTYNLPLLAIDHANKDVWVYAQKGRIHVYSIQSGLWSYFDTNPTATSAEVRAMIFDPASNRMLVSYGGAAATRFDETSDAQDSIVTGGGTAWDIRNDVVPKPFELFAARYEATLLEVGLFHLATLQSGSLSIRYSYDRGVTYATPDGYPVTTWIGNPRIRLPLAATGESVTIKISRTGAGGSRNWSISKADAVLRVHRGELTKTNAT